MSQTVTRRLQENHSKPLKKNSNNENCAPQNKIDEEAQIRHTGTKSKADTLWDCIIPNKKERTALLEINENICPVADANNSNNDYSKNIVTSQTSFGLFKSGSNLFNNITDSFSISKILSFRANHETDHQKRLELASWGLPAAILEKYHARGMNKMFPWQVECLANKRILEENRNLVYSAPTSAGKTLVSEFLILKTVLERRKKVIFILPFVSVVREKMFYFQDLLSNSGIKVEGFMGGVAPPGGFSAVHIAIVTIEKANSLINRLMEDGNLVDLGAVVIDELHLLGDPSRGYLLELLLTKLRYMSLTVEEINIQLIGMSATLPNLSLIADWLDAELYKTDFRPIPLEEQCKIGSKLFNNQFSVIRELEVAPDIVNDTENIIQLSIETINGGHGVLIFCPTKNWCEKLAVQMANLFFQLGRDNTKHGQILRQNILFDNVQEVLAQLQHCPVGLDNVLKKTVSFGVAFHHAGLTMDERDIIEGAFRVGSLKVLIATSTLSSGVNLPARRVIIRSPIFNGRILDKLTYHQMIGRAGRMGKDTAGESILICKQNERPTAEKLVKAHLEPIQSCLEGSGPLIRALLEAIASQVVKTPKDLDTYSKCTFVSKFEENNVKEMVDEAVEFLVSNEFLLLKQVENKPHSAKRIVATCLGKACLSASIPPRDGLYLFEELQRARKCFVLDTELHVIYLVTPFSASSQINQIDWEIFLELWRKLSESEKRVAQLVGVEERFLMSALRGIVKPGKSLNVHRRFFTALALHDLVREIPLNTVCKKYNCCRGLLQSLQQSSSTFAGMVTNFCKELKWDCMELLFSQFQARLQFGVSRDLLDLLRLPSLNGLRARSLFKHGITTVTELAIACELDVEEALNKALPFESEKDFDGENEAELAKKTKMRTVFITGRDGLTARQAAQIVINEARSLVKNELGAKDVHWSQPNDQNLSRLSTISNAALRTNDAISLQPLSFIQEPSIIIQLPKIIVSDTQKSVAELKNKKNVQKTEEAAKIENCLSVSDFTTTPKDLDKNSNVSATDVINNSEREATVTTRSLRSRLAGKNNELKNKDVEMTICTADFVEKMDSIIEASQKQKLSLKSKVATQTGWIEKGAKSSRKDGQITINTIDFQDYTEPQDCSKTKISKLTVKNDSILRKDRPITQKESTKVENFKKFRKNIVKKTQSSREKITFNTLDIQTSRSERTQKVKDITQDQINNQTSHNDFKGFNDEMEVQEEVVEKIPETISQKIKTNITNDFEQFSIYSFDFQDDSESRLKGTKKLAMEVIEQKENDKEEPSASINALNKIVEDKNEEAFIVPKSLNASKTEHLKDKLRLSSVSNSSAKSANMFSDSSFFDAELCSVLEKNVIDGSCLVDFECTDLTLTKFVKPQNTSKAKIQIKSRDNATPLNAIDNRVSQQITWNEDSWDQSKNIRLDDKVTDKSSANIELQQKACKENLRTRSSTRTKPIVSNTPQTTKESAAVSGNLKPILRSSKLPVKTGKLSPAFPSASDSDSDDSIFNSQAAETLMNKTRTRLLMSTQRRLNRTAKANCNTITPSNKELIEIKLKTQATTSPAGDSTVKSDSEDESDDDIFASEELRKSPRIADKKSKNEDASFAVPKIVVNNEKISLKSIVPNNVSISRHVFKAFKNEIENKKRRDLAAAFVTETFSREPQTYIGNGIIGTNDRLKASNKIEKNFVYGNKRIHGIILCWGLVDIYYVPFDSSTETKITIKERMDTLRDLLIDSSITLRCFNPKDVYKTIYTCCEFDPKCNFIDPKTGDWLLDSEVGSKTFSDMTAQYFPRGIHLANAVESKSGSCGIDECTRAAAKAVLAWYLVDSITKVIKEESTILLSAYKEVEMATIIILSRMELRGFGINIDSLIELANAVKNDMNFIESEAFKLAGRKFNFNSPKDVQQVLGLTKKGRGCTNKNALKSCDNPISNLITLWRKLNAVQSKVIFPLLQSDSNCNRLYGNCISYTVTGRITMHEPNLQTIPRDFKSDTSGCTLSVRMAFIPCEGNVILSADFCQLELRILAHFSQDPVLCQLLREKGDIFKNIAARMNKISEDRVDDDMRQKAKQLCYAMIYGMGVKSLAQNLSVSESEARDYLEAFMDTYKGIRIWLKAVTEQARTDGFVASITGRKRLLPGLNSNIPGVKSQAERQAVNTKVQGSAADITKKAMVMIETQIQRAFPKIPVTLEAVQHKRSLRNNSELRGGFLILQLHDELIYEVHSKDMLKVAKIVKESMENAFKLEVPLPVKVKVGQAWGDLQEINI